MRSHWSQPINFVLLHQTFIRVIITSSPGIHVNFITFLSRVINCYYSIFLQQHLKTIISLMNTINAAKNSSAKMTNAPLRFFRLKGTNEVSEENSVISFAFDKQKPALARNINEATFAHDHSPVNCEKIVDM